MRILCSRPDKDRLTTELLREIHTEGRQINRRKENILYFSQGVKQICIHAYKSITQHTCARLRATSRVCLEVQPPAVGEKKHCMITEGSLSQHRDATNDQFHLLTIFLINRLVLSLKCQKNGEECWSMFPKALDGILKCLVCLQPKDIQLSVKK